MLFNEYPYINLQDLNLDYILTIIKKIRSDLDDFVNLNTIKYADPINWDITRQYETNTIVVDPYDGTAYISVRPIPVGVTISNTEYWTPIFNYGNAIENIKNNVASNELHSETATKAYTANSLVWFNDELYKTIVDMPAGNAFIINENIVKCTVEEFIKFFVNGLQTALDNEITARTDADTALQTALDNEITARTNADTALQTALDNEITARTDADTVINSRIDNVVNDLNKITTQSSPLIGNVLVNHFYNIANGAINGSCYIGNGKIVGFIAPDLSDTGRFVCYNLNTYTLEFNYPLKGYHGNSVTYNKHNNHVYICACFHNANHERINVIVDVDMLQPSVVFREISLPEITECYSLSFNNDNHKFYATPYVGNTPNYSDLIYVYDENFNFIEYITLEEHPAVKYGMSTQGVQLSYGNKLYIPVYDFNGRSIFTYDCDTGELLSIDRLPRTVNMCRFLGEVESILYDYDKDRFMIGTGYYWGGAKDFVCSNIIELNMYHPINVHLPEPINFSNGQPATSTEFILGCVPAPDTIQPLWEINKNYVPLPNDAIEFAKETQCNINIAFNSTYLSVNAQSLILQALNLEDCSVILAGNDLITIEEPVIMGANVSITRATITGSKSYLGANGNVILQNGANVYFGNCTFGDLDNGYHIVGTYLSHAYCEAATFEGTQPQKIEAQGSTITIHS